MGALLGTQAVPTTDTSLAFGLAQAPPAVQAAQAVQVQAPPVVQAQAPQAPPVQPQAPPVQAQTPLLAQRAPSPLLGSVLSSPGSSDDSDDDVATAQLALRQAGLADDASTMGEDTMLQLLSKQPAPAEVSTPIDRALEDNHKLLLELTHRRNEYLPGGVARERTS